MPHCGRSKRLLRVGWRPVPKSSNLGRDLELAIAKIVEDVTEEVYDAAAETELVGIEYMKQKIETTTSAAGEARAAKGGPAGRIDTGNMYDEVTGVTYQESPTRIVTTWGWEETPLYFLAQEHGTEKIEAMESLHYSLHAADDELTSRVRRIK